MTAMLGVPSAAPAAVGLSRDPPWAWRLGHWLMVATTPHAWSVAHRGVVAALAATLAFAVASQALRSIGLPEHLTSRSKLDELARRVEDARSNVATLPRIRASAPVSGSAPGASPERRPSLHWQAISSLAQRSGMTIRALEPGTSTGADAHAARAVRLSARAPFEALVAFMRRLSSLPSLVVPTALKIEQVDAELGIEAVLHVYDALPVVAAPTASPHELDRARVAGLHDPFDARGASPAPQVRVVRLLGIMRDRTHALAVLETSDGAIVSQVGQTVGADRLTQIGQRGVMLASEGGERTVTLASNPGPS